MATYTEMVKMVRDWSNRDTEVLSDRNIKTFLEFAVDNVYRDLRIAPLEFTYPYDTDLIVQGGNTLPIPSDTIEFIQLRKKDNNSLTDYVVYNNKSDIRSFYDEWQTKGVYNNYFFTREGNNLIMYPDHNKGDEFELFYYRRLADLDARYTIDTDTETTDTQFFSTTRDGVITAAGLTEKNNIIGNDPDLTVTSTSDSDFWIGAAVPNWIRDQNEKLILFGALAEAFTYLDEPEQAAKYGQRFDQELQNLNGEEMKRKYEGGAITVHYRSNLI